MTGERVVVGLDGSAAAERALAWAIDEQKALPAPTVVAVYGRHETGLELHGERLGSDEEGTTKGDAERVVASVAEAHPALEALVRPTPGSAGPALVAEAAEARMLVVGSRRSTSAVTHLAPTASYCVQHSPVPVVVVPETAPTDGPLQRVVVGVDGSPNSRAALRWASCTVRSGGALEVVGAWLPSDEDGTVTSASEADRMLRRITAGTVPIERDAELDVDVRIWRGQPSEVLREASDHADLLVVGARGHHGIDYVLGGSATTSLLHQPPVATAFVPAAVDPSKGGARLAGTASSTARASATASSRTAPGRPGSRV